MKLYGYRQRARIANPIGYEWVVELVDSYGDIYDTIQRDTLSEALLVSAEEPNAEIGLVRNVINEDGYPEDRQWAYLDDNGALPDMFDGGAKVPAVFKDEVQRARRIPNSDIVEMPSFDIAKSYPIGTVFRTSDGNLWRSRKTKMGAWEIVRMTKRVAGGEIELKEGEEEYFRRYHEL